MRLRTGHLFRLSQARFGNGTTPVTVHRDEPCRRNAYSRPSPTLGDLPVALGPRMPGTVATRIAAPFVKKRIVGWGERAMRRAPRDDLLVDARVLDLVGIGDVVCDGRWPDPDRLVDEAFDLLHRQNMHLDHVQIP
jgi:hypothetical protein